jgi:chromosome segregation protein
VRLASVEFCGFRGFKHRARFDFPSGFAVLTGRNGVGKSTVLDAVDFALTGTINKFAVTGAKGGGLDEHIWWVGDNSSEKQYVTVTFVDEHEQTLEITRSRDRGLQTPLDQIAKRLCDGETVIQGWPETLMRTTLIRDETVAALSLDLPEQARFAAVRSAIGGLGGPDYSHRTALLMQAASVAKKEQEQRVVNAQAELGRALSALTEARSIAEKQTDVAEASKLISAIVPNFQGTAVERAEAIRKIIATTKQALQALTIALTRAVELDSERRYLDSEVAKAEAQGALDELNTVKEARSLADSVMKGAAELEASERQSDAFVSHFVALLEHGTAIGLQENHCPLCDSIRSQEDFNAAIEAARKRLSDRGDRIVRLASALSEAKAAWQRAEDAVRRAEQRVAAIEARESSYAQGLQIIADTFSRWNFGAAPTDLVGARELMLEREEEALRIEHANYLLDVSSAHDRVSSLQARVEQLRMQVDEETEKLATANRAMEAARQIEAAAKAVANEISAEQFDTVLPLLKELYRRLRPHTTWREIETDFGGRVRASLNFTVGDGRNPQFLFSSGQRRAAGIAFLLAIHLSRPWCRLRSLLLDDPVQHVDDYRALNLVELLSAVRRTGRQVVIAVEDPALADLLCRRLRSTPLGAGRRFDLCTSTDGSAAIESEIDILPLPRATLRLAS